MYVILEHRINKVEKISKLIGIYFINSRVLYIYQVLSKNHHRFIHNNYNKNLYNNINSVIMYLSNLKEKSDDR